MPSIGIHPQPDESLPGILVRLAERIGIPGAHRLAAMTVLRQPGSAVTSHDLARLAAFGEFDPADLERAAYRPAARFAHHRFLSGDVHRELIDLSRRRWCPTCLSVSPYHRMQWDFGLLTACPVHAVRLETRCPTCLRSLDWRHPGISRCRCGASVVAATPSPVTEDERRTAERLLELLGPSRIETVPAPLGDVTGSDTIRMAMGIGMMVTGWRRDRRVETLVASGPDRTNQVMSAGLAFVDDWPETLHGYLRDLSTDAGARVGRYGARKTLGVFYDWLTIMPEGDVRRVLLDATAEFVGADAVIGRRVHRSKLLTSVSTGDRPGMALSEVKAVLGAREPRIAKLGQLGLVPTGEGDGRGVPMVFDRLAVETFAAAATRSVDLAETARLLGVSKDRTRRLVDAGFVRPLHRATEDGMGAWAFDRADIEGFLSGLEAFASSGTGEELVGFEFAVEALRIRGRRFVEAVGLISHGVLPVAAVDERVAGLKRLRFRRDQVRRVCGEADERARITVAEAAKRLGMKWEMVAHLVRRELIAETDQGLAAADVDRFAEQHVTGAELARQRKTSPRSLAEKLAAEGILPVVGPGVDGARQNVYLRRKVLTE